MANLPDDLQAALDVAARLHAQAMSILSIQRNVGHFTTLVFGVTSLNDGEPVRDSWRDAVGELLSIHATESPKIRAVISQLQPQPRLFTCGGIRAPTASELLLKVCDEIEHDYKFVFREPASEPLDSNALEAMLASAGPDFVPPADHMSLLAGIIADRVSLHGALLQQLTSLRESIDAEIRFVDWQRRNTITVRESGKRLSVDDNVVPDPIGRIPIDTKPRWIKRTGQLLLGETIIKTVQVGKARNVVRILDEFQRENWKNNKMYDPLPGSENAKRRLAETRDSLNSGLTHIRFSTSNGTIISWERIDQV